MSTITNASIFIIPNKAWNPFKSDTLSDIGVKWHKESIERISMDSEWDIQEGDRMVQVWVTSEDSDNWGSHNLPLYLDPEAFSEDIPTYERKRFPTYVPVRMLEGKKEGDSFTISILGEEVTLTCAQTQFRYRGMGTFEEVLAKVA